MLSATTQISLRRIRFASRVNLLRPTTLNVSKLIGDAGISHHFSFAQFLHANALCAQRDLQSCKSNKFVGFDMRAIGKTQPVAMALPALQIGQHDVEVNQRHGCFKILDVFSHIFEFEKLFWR